MLAAGIGLWKDASSHMDGQTWVRKSTNTEVCRGSMMAGQFWPTSWSSEKGGHGWKLGTVERPEAHGKIDFRPKDPRRKPICQLPCCYIANLQLGSRLGVVNFALLALGGERVLHSTRAYQITNKAGRSKSSERCLSRSGVESGGGLDDH